MPEVFDLVKVVLPVVTLDDPLMVPTRRRVMTGRADTGGRNREKARLIFAKRHEKIVNQCKDFLHKLSRRIVDENQVIVMETLKSKNMMKNHKVAKSIGDVSWYEFIRQLEYKCTF